MPKNKHLINILLLIAVLVAASLSLSHPVLADAQYQYTPLATVPIGNTGAAGNLTTAGTQVTPSSYIQNLYVFAFSIATVIAVGSGVWAGVQWMFGGDSPSRISNAKKRLEGVGWGFGLLLCSYLILYTINPQLVTFNLNLGTINNAVIAGDLAAEQTSESSAATQAITAQINSQSLQQQVTSLQTQIDTCTAMQGNSSTNSAANLSANGCDSAGMATLNSSLATAQTAYTQSQNAAAQAVAAQTAAAQTAVATAKTNLATAQAALDTAPPPTGDALANAKANVAVATADLTYQTNQQTNTTAMTSATANVAKGDLTSISNLNTQVGTQLTSLSQQYAALYDLNTDQLKDPNSAALVTDLNNQIQNLQSTQKDLGTLMSNATTIQSSQNSGTFGVGVGFNTAISSAGTPASMGITGTGAAAAKAYEAALNNLPVTTGAGYANLLYGGGNATVGTVVSQDVSGTITNPSVQALQNAYVASQQAAIQAAVVKKCQAAGLTGC